MVNKDFQIVFTCRWKAAWDDVLRMNSGRHQPILNLVDANNYELRLLYIAYILVTSLLVSVAHRAEPETVISRAWVQSPDPAE